MELSQLRISLDRGREQLVTSDRFPKEFSSNLSVSVTVVAQSSTIYENEAKMMNGNSQYQPGAKGTEIPRVE